MFILKFSGVLVMKSIKKVAIIGNAGSGKSTLTKKMQHILQLPVYHLDQYFWKPHWTRPNPEEYKIVHDAICDQDEWIIDGMNLRLLEYRIQKADSIIFLDIPRYKCFWRIFKRTITYYGRETPSSAQQCPERLNKEFVQFLMWVWNFKVKYKPRIVELLNCYKDTKKIYTLSTQGDIDHYLQKLIPHV